LQFRLMREDWPLSRSDAGTGTRRAAAVFGLPLAQQPPSAHGAPEDAEADSHEHVSAGVEDAVPDEVEFKVLQMVRRIARAGQLSA
jgi:hypothetical protein